MQKSTATILILFASRAIASLTSESAIIQNSINTNDNYIKAKSYLQNPYRNLPSGGTGKFVYSKPAESQTTLEHLFTEGTWNAYGFSGMQDNQNKPTNYNVSGALFGQTGAINGFSLGGAFIAANPFIQNQNTSAGLPPYIFMASEQYYALNQGFLEYQYSHILQADAGFIAINNSPWLAANYYSSQSSAVTYQGASVNLNPSSGVLITALAFNGANYPGYSGFTGNTLYNPGALQNIQTGISQGSNGTMALGTSYFTPNNMYNIRAWAYQFNNYATLVYADNSIKFMLDNPSNTYLSFAVQGGREWGNSTNAITNAGLGDIDSNFAGAQAIFNYNWLTIALGYENVWGPANAFGHGAIVSPYTYNENVDPMYANSWMTSLVQKASSGQMYNITATIKLLDSNLSFAPAYSQVVNTVGQPANSILGTSNPDQEFDLVFNYKVKQVSGLKLFGVYGYMWNNSYTPYNSTAVVPANTTFTALFMAQYLY